MKLFSFLAVGLIALVLTPVRTLAATPADNYTLLLDWCTDAPEKIEAYFLLGPTGAPPSKQTAYHTPAALTKVFAALPQGSTVDWSPSCCVLGPSPVKDHHLEEWRATCLKVGVTFTLHPSG